MALAAGLLILIEEIHSVGAAEIEIDRVDVVRQRRNGRGKILRAKRHPLAARDLPAKTAKLEDEAGGLRVREGIVLADDRDLLVAFLVESVVAEAGRPLGAVHVEAEEVRRSVRERGLLRARSRVDEGQFGVGLRKVLDSDALVAGQRRQQNL